jgi:hypothetical protein
MNLAKALKEKNRLAKKMSNIQSLIQQGNSIPKASEREVNINTLIDDLELKTQQLIQLKIKIFEASRPIREHILKMAELKTRINFLQSVSTTKGLHRPGYGADLIEYDAVLTSKTIQDIVEKHEKEIDELQDEIDTFNYTTEIE